MSPSVIAGRPLVPGEQPLTKDNPNHDGWAPVTEIDRRDVRCADSWVPRHPELIRLTGAHPFNSEPPHKTGFDAGWLTPVSLHLVRNHGAVPKLDWSTHTIKIGGLVNAPASITMEQLMKFPMVTVPCLVSCCGNRRKEVNMVKNSQGFSWGPGAVGVNYWTGVRLSDVLRSVGVKTPAEGASHVHFSGPKGELPKGDDGSYGTAMTLTYAMDPANDVLIAVKQNGQFLHPDHGFPCRMLIPGWIGGRMIKWLSYISVSDTDSENWYHIHDNKVLPPHVTAELAVSEGWWRDPNYILYDLPINSTIVHPGHDERVYLDRNRPFTMKGYAYSGGGRKITRVEVSFDGGRTWSKPCKLEITEKPNAYGKYWTWVHWSLEMQTFDFLTATEVVCRAYDVSQNTQPDVLTWSLLGQGNNSMFRLRLHKDVDGEGRMCIRFQQPAPLKAGELGNLGWREEAQLLAADAPEAKKEVVAVAAAALDPSKKFLKMAAVEPHDTEESVWFVYQGKVYDGTPFLEEHPGGADSMLMVGGTDATEDFNAVHSDAAKELLLNYYIADLAPDDMDIPPEQLYVDGSAAGVATAKAAAAVDAPPFLNPKVAKKAVLQEKIELSHDVILFRFGLDHPTQALGLPTGKHMLLRAYSPNKEGVEELVMRAYTPTTANETLGHFDLVVKIYRRDTHPRFPDGGRMSQILEHMPIGDALEIKGPIGHFHYKGRGAYTQHKQEGFAKRINMIAGGTGITPMYQVMKEILSDPEDTTELRLLYANQTEDDILVRQEMEALEAKHPDRLKLHYTVDRPKEGWKYSSGFINEEMCRLALFEHEEGTITLLCGPPPMLQYACHPNLEKMGFEKGSTSIEF